MPSFLPGFGMFVAAGAVAAIGPLAIHLLNRRRYRTIDWAAMDFLRQAIDRHRKVFQLRDLLLLFLRTIAVLLFGFALARPFFATTGGTQIAPGDPVHAILIIDNSMSMAYRQGAGTLLDDAKSRARDFIVALPDGSRVTVLPLCGGSAPTRRDAYRTKKDVIEALSRIAVVDCAGTVARAAELAREAMQQAPEFPDRAKRIVFLSDQQAENWKGATPELFKGLPEVQIVDLSAREPENTWISNFQLLDGVATAGASSQFVEAVTYQGPKPRKNVQITLSIEGHAVQSKSIDLNPNQTVQLTFDHEFVDAPRHAEMRWTTAEVSLAPDRLAIDDSRSLVVPIVAAIPVVFVDQYGESEDPQQNRIGETYDFRRLLDHKANRQLSGFVQARKRTIDQLNQRDLRDARMVVLAGIARPDSAETIRLLRQYVEQGGQLVIAAGAKFDPAGWNDLAWLDGAGILPLPLVPRPLGETPEEFDRNVRPSGDAAAQKQPEFKVFSLSVGGGDIASNAYLQLPQTDPQEIADSLREPTFFKLVVAKDDKPMIEHAMAAETQRISRDRKQLADLDAEIQSLSEIELRGQLDSANRTALDRLQQRRNEISPSWLSFEAPTAISESDLPPSTLAERSRPRVQLRFDNRAPFLVERDIGRGHVVFITSGFYSDWNDLPRKNAVWLIDRMLRSRIAATLPVRNVDTSAPPLLIGILPEQRNEAFLLARPDGTQKPLDVARTGPNSYAVSISDFAQRGIYRVATRQALRQSGATDGPDAPHENNFDAQTLIAANGPVDESKLASIDERVLTERFARSGIQDAASTAGGEFGSASVARYRWVARGEPINLSGGEIWGQDTWWWLLLTVLACLLTELAILAWPAMKQHQADRREAAHAA